jgi:nucleoside-diphosphate-sugar epimerase
MATESRSPRSRRKLALVTGATGFVGRHLVRGLRDAGWRIRVLVRDPARFAADAHPHDEVHQGDLTDAASLAGVCDGVDVVFHAACAVAGTFDAGRSAVDAFLAVNRDGTANLAAEVLKHPGVRLVHVSSTAAMGNPRASVVNEDTPCNPSTPYQVSKRAAELSLLELHEKRGLNVVIVRPCVVAGEGKENSEFLKMFRMVQRNSFPLIGGRLDLHKPIIAVEDLVQALILAAQHGTSGRIYLVHDDGGHTLGDMIEAAAELTGAHRGYVRIPGLVGRVAAEACELGRMVAPNWNPPLTRDRLELFMTDRRIDIARARAELGYAPTHQDLREMLGRTFDDFVRRSLL